MSDERKIKELEESWLSLKDQYSEVARALGFPGVGWFDDPSATHAEVVERAKQLYADAGVAANA